MENFRVLPHAILPFLYCTGHVGVVNNSPPDHTLRLENTVQASKQPPLNGWAFELKNARQPTHTTAVFEVGR
jgi:hypothetical protein